MPFSQETADDIFIAQSQLATHSDLNKDDFVWLVDVSNDGLLMIEKSDFRGSMPNLPFQIHDREDFVDPIEQLYLMKPLNLKNSWFFKKDNFTDKLTELKQLFKIPIQYEQFLIKYNGGILENNAQSGIYIPALDTYVYLSLLFGLNTNNIMNNIIVINKKFKSYLPANMLIIGEDLTNGFIVMDLTGDNPVYYWDINSYYKYSSQTNNAYLISESIEELFQNIKNK